MSAAQDVKAARFDWRVEVERAKADPHGAADLQSRRDEARANSLGLIITTSIFFVLLAAAIMFGGHAAIGPLLRRAVEAPRPAGVTGDLLYTMPDGVFCRHMAYDNATGNLIDGDIVRCPDGLEGGAPSDASGFKWDAH